jgi:hypothetical protein
MQEAPENPSMESKKLLTFNLPAFLLSKCCGGSEDRLIAQGDLQVILAEAGIHVTFPRENGSPQSARE